MISSKAAKSCQEWSASTTRANTSGARISLGYLSAAFSDGPSKKTWLKLESAVEVGAKTALRALTTSLHIVPLEAEVERWGQSRQEDRLSVCSSASASEDRSVNLSHTQSFNGEFYRSFSQFQ